MSETEEKKIRLVITDRYCINNHRTNLNKDLCFSIREISLDLARHYVHECDTFFNTFQIKTDYIREIYSQIIENKPEKCSEEIFKIDDETSFLIISVNENGNIKFHLIQSDI